MKKQKISMLSKWDGPPLAHLNTWSSVTDWFGKDYMWCCWKGYHWGWVLRFQRLTHSQLPTPLSSSLSPYCFCAKMSAVSCSCSRAFFLPSWADKANHMLSFRSCIDQLFLSSFWHSYRKVTKTQGITAMKC